MLARHVSDLTGPSSGAFYKLYLQTLVCGNTRTTRPVQPLLCNGWTCRLVPQLYHIPKSAYTACKTLLKVDRWGPKHVEVTYVMNKLNHKTTLCILLDCIYITRWYTVPTISRFVILHETYRYFSLMLCCIIPWMYLMTFETYILPLFFFRIRLHIKAYYIKIRKVFIPYLERHYLSLCLLTVRNKILYWYELSSSS